MYLCIIFAAIGILIGAARLYSRLFITKAPGLDDALVMVALGFLTALMVLVIIGNKDFYSGRHVWDIPPSSFVGARINIWASLWCYIIGITLIKISVLLFYRRLSVKFSRAFLIATWIGIVYNVLYILSFGLTLLLMCRPLHAYWDEFDPVWATTHHFSCAREGAALPASSAFSVAGDFYATLLPLILVYYLDLPRRQKFALYGLFALGFMAVAAGVVRTVLMYNLLNKDYDFTWELWLTWVWAVLELYMALIAASAPSLKPFFQRFFVESINSIGRSSRRRREYGAGGGTGPRSVKGTNTTTTTDAHTSVTFSKDVERGSRPWVESNERSVSQQSWFLRDGADAGTRHLELRTTEDGRRMIPMRVYRQEEDALSALPGQAYTDPTHRGHPSSPISRQEEDGLSALPGQNYMDRMRRGHSKSPTPRLDWPLPAQGTEPREFLAEHRLSRYSSNG